MNPIENKIAETEAGLQGHRKMLAQLRQQVAVCEANVQRHEGALVVLRSLLPDPKSDVVTAPSEASEAPDPN